MSRLDHWAALSIGSKWFEAGKTLAEHDTAAASQAFIWARFCYSQYQQAWENSSASRWDPDALDDIAAVDAALAQLYAAPALTEQLPAWATELLKGIVPQATDLPDDPAFLLGLKKIATEFNALT